jgi:2-polyprenyl-6-methoxyphenol hydroxylase-like FAD-dependent oxidoreductase
VGTAIVIGASMAGLCTARVLSERFDTVTVLDRDTLPADNTPRRGVPQSAQGHVLLVSGLHQLAALFPGLDDEMVAAGGTRFDPGLGLCQFRWDRRWPKAPTGLDLVSISRPQLELLVRRRTQTLPGVTLRDGVAVTGLTGDGDRVTGVTLDTGETLTADLVADCSGRGSRSDRWLAGLGFPAPEQVEIKVGVGYSTRLYRRRPGDLPDWVAAFTLPAAPAQRAAGVLLPIEDDRWLMLYGGWHLEHPPADAASWEAAVRDLPDPVMSEVMDRAEPLTDPVVHRFPSSRRRRFEALDRLPGGFVALGDTVCSFNPIYGQGMTVAALEAAALGTVLDRHPDAGAAMAADFYRAAATVIATPWQFAAGADFAYPQTTGPRPRGTGLTNWFAYRISRASQVSADINATFMAVQQLVTPPSVLTRPAFVARVLWNSRASAVSRR